MSKLYFGNRTYQDTLFERKIKNGFEWKAIFDLSFKDHIFAIVSKANDVIRETSGPAFFRLLARAAQPQKPPHAGTSESHSSGDCNGKKTHSRTSGDASAKRDEKSH